jgi:hypothetical protein
LRDEQGQLLHDDLQQFVASAKLQLQLPPESLLTTVEKLLEDSIAKSRNLSHELKSGGASIIQGLQAT